MDINTSNIRALANLSDSEFSKIVYSIAISMGLPHDKAVNASHNTAFFRMLLANASDKDIENLMGKVGKDKIDGIYSSLDHKGNKQS